MILECRNLYKTYSEGKVDVPALKDATFSMDEGEYVAIMGPSGSGKSTLMNLIGCLDVPTSGELIIDGENISNCTEDDLAQIRLKKIGFIFQSFQLLSHKTALSNVELPLYYAGVPKGERKDIAMSFLEKVGLGDRADFLPNQMSGGQKQRVAIARAMVNNPKILLADEPTGALDQASGRQVMEIFKTLNDEGMTIMMITHDEKIAKNANRILTIIDGNLYDGGIS